MIGVSNDRVRVKLSGETFQFLYNKEKQEIYNELFPGIKIDRVRVGGRYTVPHDVLLKIVDDKQKEFELAIAKAELTKAINSFTSKDFCDLF